MNKRQVDDFKESLESQIASSDLCNLFLQRLSRQKTHRANSCTTSKANKADGCQEYMEVLGETGLESRYKENG